MKQQTARFTTGSTLRHVIVMTLTNSIGLMALFFVDLMDLYFLNLLGEQEMAASVGFSSQLLFYMTAISIGFLVSIGVLVSQRIGAKKTDEAKRIVGSALVIGITLMLIVSGILFMNIESLLIMLGAKGRTLELAVTYASILLPSSVILISSMICSSVVRATGDAKRSMYATLIGALVNLCFDPLLIFAFDMGVAGAAWASVLSRLAMFSYSFYNVSKVYHIIAKPTVTGIINDFKAIAKLSIPAMLTNLASPIGSTFVMTAIARYGDAAVAAYATIGRMIPVAFSVLFALSGAISPIIGQNFGAKHFDRVKSTYHNAITFAVSYVIGVALLILLGQNYIVSLFSLSGEAAQLLRLFCSGLAFCFIADGILFSTNSVFNSLGYPLYSTVFNYAKFFIGVIPAVYTLSYFYGAKGVIIGQAIGPILVTIVAVWACHHLITRVSHGNNPPTDNHKPRKRFIRMPLWASSSGKTQA